MRGYTLIEMAMVLLIAVTLLSIVTVTFSGYNERTSARRSAQVFARDLTMARSMAVRGRETVTITFYVSTKWYKVTTASGRELARRRFGSTQELNLSAVTLDLGGDSVQFSTRGVGNLGAATLGTAIFTAGDVAYQVQFNSMGASKVGEL
ncbi:MAG: prepilin-type N-terminal cleavage/methylation domain-containing protein [Gemmatimonadetes bacterium]|nr:prepilin-type N-terminal cleavage/methylation domain-containing protein [Gemmatimonadota bacterium]